MSPNAISKISPKSLQGPQESTKLTPLCLVSACPLPCTHRLWFRPACCVQSLHALWGYIQICLPETFNSLELCPLTTQKLLNFLKWPFNYQPFNIIFPWSLHAKYPMHPSFTFEKHSSQKSWSSCCVEARGLLRGLNTSLPPGQLPALLTIHAINTWQS